MNVKKIPTIFSMETSLGFYKKVGEECYDVSKCGTYIPKSCGSVAQLHSYGDF